METAPRTPEDVAPVKKRRTHVTSANSAHSRRQEIAQELQELDRREAFGEFDTTVAASDEISYAEYLEAHEKGASNDHYDETLGTEDYSGESLEQLAQRVAAARTEGDKTKLTDAENAFFEKFSAYAEKYDWESDENSGADEVHVNAAELADTPVSRQTVDSRLQRYADIMYGTEASAGSSEKEAITDIDESEPEAQAQDIVAKYETLSHEQKAVLAPHIEAVIDTIDGAPSQTLATDDAMPQLKPLIQLPETEYAYSEVNEDMPELRPLIDIDSYDQSETNATRPTGKWANILGRVSDRVATAKRGLEDGGQYVGSVLAVAAQRKLEQHRNRDTSEDKEHTLKGRTKLAIGIVGVAAAGVVFAYAAQRHGIENPFKGNNNLNVSGADGLGGSVDVPNGSSAETPASLQFSGAEVKISRGEGWFQTMREMHIPSGDRHEILQEVGPKLRKVGAAYYDSGAHEYRMERGNGKLSTEALTIIADAAKARGIAVK